ncbi:MAG: hypothetical protein A3G75_06295 [Verrucomicrobia bacterium RIFCSPLOWO2_12_FULL_64_8]|nr:MAG: hypothetical protein A3G75_06295 [Verrucomicrobia bacterium RIFCSPLOWO2_12_FULL_64_8]
MIRGGAAGLGVSLVLPVRRTAIDQFAVIVVGILFAITVILPAGPAVIRGVVAVLDVSAVLPVRRTAIDQSAVIVVGILSMMIVIPPA